MVLSRPIRGTKTVRKACPARGSDHMDDRLDRTLPPTWFQCHMVLARFHDSDGQVEPAGATLTRLVACPRLLLAVLTPFGHDFKSNSAPIQPLKNLGCPCVFHTFQEINNFTQKLAQRPQMGSKLTQGGSRRLQGLPRASQIGPKETSEPQF